MSAVPEGSVAHSRSTRPQSVLFMCGQNVVRSVMAAALLRHLYGKSIYVGSAGVIAGEADPFVTAVMEEIGLDVHKHRPKSVEELSLIHI